MCIHAMIAALIRWYDAQNVDLENIGLIPAQLMPYPADLSWSLL
jgi:hypothetical protein